MVAIGIGVGVVFGGAVPAPFSPLDLSPALWLDAADATTITASSGAVSEWRDRSGNARHVSQGTAAAQPTTGAATLNGLNVLSFNDDRLKTATATSSAVATIFVVAAATSSFADRRMICGNGTDTFQTTFATNLVSIYANAAFVPGPVVSLNTYASVTYLLNGASTQVFTNGVGGTAGNPGTASASLATIGSTSSGSVPFIGNIAEIVIYSVALNGTDRAKVGTYLANKWGTP